MVGSHIGAEWQSCQEACVPDTMWAYAWQVLGPEERFLTQKSPCAQPLVTFPNGDQHSQGLQAKLPMDAPSPASGPKRSMG